LFLAGHQSVALSSILLYNDYRGKSRVLIEKYVGGCYKMQTRANVAGPGVPLITRPQVGLDYNRSWAPEVLRLGRYLCWAFYREQSEVLFVFPKLASVIEEAVKTYGPWGELLSGAYHSPKAKTSRLILYGHTLRNGRGPAEAQRQGIGKKTIVKFANFGDIVDIGIWKDMKSIDGAGEVRALEICLYQFVAYRFLGGVIAGAKQTC
jgi:hypothetical protein